MSKKPKATTNARAPSLDGVPFVPTSIELVPIETLIPYARNARTHSDVQVAQVAASIREFGFTNPVLVADGTIIAGHGRVLAARVLGMAYVPTVDLSHLTPVQRRAYVLADNQLATKAGWDDEMLSLELADLKAEGFDLNLTGFDVADLAGILDRNEGQTDPDDVPEVPTKPVTVPGDVWLLGRHRIVCGDSTTVESVDRCLAGAKADLCFTSPPYGAKKNELPSRTGKRQKATFYDTHDDAPGDWPDLMDGWWSASVGHVSAWSINVQPVAGNRKALVKFVADRAGQLVDVVTWVKGNGVPCVQGGVLSSGFEWLLIFGADEASRVVPFASWQGTVSNVINLTGNVANEFANIHRAVMPVEFAVWVISKVHDKSKSIYEPFSGSGTTIIACEQTGRVCHAIELSPAYVDVAVKRWQSFTGKAATLEDDGRTFEAVALSRA